MKKLPAMRSILFVALVATASWSCHIGPEPQQPPGRTPYADDISATSKVQGYAWDPEIFLLNVLQCGPECEFWPAIMPFNPLFDGSTLTGSQVSMMTVGQSWEQTRFATEADPFGLWELVQVPVRAKADSYLYPRTEGGMFALPDEEFPFDRGPPTEYLPTVNLRPVDTSYFGHCVNVGAGAMSGVGVLEAVAKYLTLFEETPTDVGDFLDAAKYSGAAVFWLMYPYDANFPLAWGAEMSTIEASRGRVFNVTWAPPGVLDPSFQSERGFFVDPDMPASDWGLVVVLVPAGGGSEPVTLLPVDTVEEPMYGRPWIHRPLTLPLSSSHITLGVLQMSYNSPPGDPRQEPQAILRDPIACYPTPEADAFREGALFNEL